MQQHATLQNYIKTGITPALSIRALRSNELVLEYVEGATGPEAGAMPITARTRFNIGSVTKPVTASLVVKLIEMGELSLDDRVVRYIPEYPFDHVTLLNLMTHTAGYADNHAIPWPIDRADLPRYFAAIYGIGTLKFETGTSGAYFSQGYSVLMDVLQRVTGRAIEEFARAVLFEPLGMTHSTYDVSTLGPAEFVLPYSAAEKRHTEELRTAPPTGDSGLFSTAADLVAFGQMILDGGNANGGRVLSKASIALMLREVTAGRFMRTPAFWQKGPTNLHRCFGDLCSEATVGHPGFSGCMLFIDPVNHTTGAIVSNSTALHADWGNYRRISNLILSS